MLFLREPPPALAPVAPDIEACVRDRLAHLLAHLPTRPSSILAIVPPGAAVAIEGIDVVDAERWAREGANGVVYDAAVCVDSADRVRDPDDLLARIWSALCPGAPVSFTVPSVDSGTARYAGASWSGFRTGAWLFHGIDTFQSALIRRGFRHPRTYVDATLPSHSLRVRGAAKVLGVLHLRAAAMRAVTRGRPLDESMTLICRRDEPIERHRLSVIVPVFNERRTFDEVMGKLVAKTIDGVDIEIIVVESNSGDGSREAALKYVGHPRVDVLLQSEPRGKGNAVRAGIARASGDIVMFQDADLEYEIEDYDDLVRPIVEYKRNFVIGSRHEKKGSAWKMRSFTGAPMLSQVFNAGHLVFLGLLNGLYAQSLEDPFSMFKVFRRDCIAGLVFESDRFDFDFEIVIKLLRKGYRPFEIPVNYRSRSIAEGKKVSMLRDPLTWLAALVRFRNSPLYPQDARGADQ